MPIPLQAAQDLASADIAVNSLTLLSTTAGNIRGIVGNTLALTAARTLLAGESGSTVIWNSATGFTITLPTPVLGMEFNFIVGVTNTGTACKIITSAASVFLLGGVTSFVDATTPGANPGPKGFLFNGTSHVACTMGGTDTTTGGLAGTRVRVKGLSATQWLIDGTLLCAGTIATPAATS